MSGSRRTQRSVRVTVASSLIFLAAGLVLLAVVTTTWVSAAAVSAVVLGAVASRIGYGEVTMTRGLAAIDRAEQARVFGAAWTDKQREHTSFTTAMTVRLQDQERTIVGLEGTVRLAERRADEAEPRVQREARRATDAQQRLSSLLDELLRGQSGSSEAVEDEAGDRREDGVDQHAASAEMDAVSRELSLVSSSEWPAVIDLLAWENRAKGSSRGGVRRQA